MKQLLLLVSFLFVTSAGAQGLHVVFDLDGTLIENVAPEAPLEEGQKAIRWRHETYRLNDFAPEVVDRLAGAGYKVSFFSGGDRERNEVVIDALKELIELRTGRRFEPYRILSREDLTPVFGRPETARFRDRFKKDLQKVAFPMDVVLVDDLPELTMVGQERSILQVPPDSQGVRHRNKLLVAMEILLQAKEAMGRSPIQYLQAVRGLARGVMTAPNAPDYDDEAFLDVMRKGLNRLGAPFKINEPSYPIYLRARSCSRVFQ